MIKIIRIRDEHLVNGKIINLPRDVTILYCAGCTRLEEIPVLDSLKSLYCSNCPLITKIPQLNKLELLNCHSCPLVEEIPSLDKLKELSCENCPLIKEIPILPKLEILECDECPIFENAGINSINGYHKWLKQVQMLVTFLSPHKYERLSKRKDNKLPIDLIRLLKKY